MTPVGDLLEVIVYVEDMHSQVTFYRDILGLEVVQPREASSFGDVFWVEFDTGGCTLALHAGGARRFGQDAPKFVFRVADVPSVHAELQALGVPMGEIRSPAPGVQVCDGADPEGNRFSIESK